VAIHPKRTAFMENSSPMAGRAMLMDEAMKGGVNAVRVAMIRAQLLMSESEQVGGSRVIVNPSSCYQ